MKNFVYVLACLILTFCSHSGEKKMSKAPEGRIMDFEQLSALFADPPAEYRTAPFWVWNKDVTRADIDRTLSEFKDKGMGGVFLHPRYGLITEYLSDEWFDLVEYSLQKAEELDLELWIYDENSFPSGFAGGHVAAQMPEANSEGVALRPYFMDELHIPEEAERPLHIFKKEVGSWVEITGKSGAEKGKKGEYCVLDLNDYERSKWFGGYSYVDLLKPGVTEKFIEITMPGYEKTLGHEFGKRVPGVFTDEPNTNSRSAGPIRYTPDLYEQFEKQWGYRLERHLMSLITETGDWKKVRHNYQSTILQLFIDRWAKPWYEYTEKRNLEWTGHYWEHGWPSPLEGPDNMAMYAWHQTPGIDMLFNAEEARPDQFGNIRNVKELSSVVNQFDRHRALSETYGAAGWELTFDDMKRLGDWEYVLGVNLMNQHLAYMSLAGDRKHDFPQSFGTHAPYWGHYRYQADYFARLSLALASGRQLNRILVIEPTTTAWMYYNPRDRRNGKMNMVKEQFEPFLGQLEKFQVEYDLGCENIIKDHGKVENGKFVINKAAYDLVIIPPGLENLDRSTFNMLSQYVSSGGKVLEIAAKAAFVDGVPMSYEKLREAQNWEKHNAADEKLLTELAENEQIVFENAGQARGKLFHQRREFNDGQLLFLTNFDRNETAEINIKMKGNSVLDLNAQNGHISPYEFTNSDGRVSFNVELPPSGSRLLFVSEKSGESIARSAYDREPIPTGNSVVKAVTPNILNLDYVELTVGDFNKAPMYFYSAGNEIWKAHGYPDNPWVSSSQFKTELVDADTFPPGTGFKVVYPFVVGEGFDVKDVQLVVERPWLYTVKVNEQEVSALENRSWLDPDFRVFEIGNLIQKGRNEVEISADPFSMFCELEPVYLLGNFSVLPADKGFRLENPSPLGLGSWKAQGMPFYGQTVAYTKRVDVNPESDFVIRLPEWLGTVAEVVIDGKHRGIIYSKPFELKVHLSEGEHEITVNVVGSNKNTLGPHHNFRTPGIVTPWSFKFAPEVQPPGTGYDLLDYGLMKDFEIYRLIENNAGI